MNALTPDANNLLFHPFSPAPFVGVVDPANRKFDRMPDVPDRYHIFAASPTVCYMNCRDGTLARVDFADGEAKVSNSEVFHTEEELLINYSARTGRLIWPTYPGKIFRIDLTAE